MNRNASFTVGGWTVEPDRDRLNRGREQVRLRPQVMELLLLFSKNAGQVISLEDITSVVWKGKYVTSSSVYGCLNELRQVLGDDPHEPTYIETIPKKGYRLIAPVGAFSREGGTVGIEPGSPGRLAPTWTHARGIPLKAIGLTAFVLLLTYANPFDVGMFDAHTHSANTDPAKTSPDSSITVSPTADTSQNARAREHYQQGRFFYSRRAEGDVERARNYFKLALDEDPSFTQAWVSLAGVYGLLEYEGGMDAGEAWARQGEAIQRALALQPDLPEVQVRAAGYYQSADDWETAELHLKRASELGRDNVLVQSVLAGHAAWDGRLDEAIRLQRRAVALEPLNTANRGNLASYLSAAGFYEEAVTEKLKALELSPSMVDEAEVFISYALILQGQFDEAFTRVRQLPGAEDRDLGLALIYTATGQAPEAAAALERLTALTSPSSATRLAKIYAQRADFDASFRWLDEARLRVSRGGQYNAQLRWLTKVNFCPILRPLQSDSRWAGWLDDTRKMVKKTRGGQARPG